jgi:hypothetical protein
MNTTKAENLQLLTVSALIRGEDNVMSREMMCGIIDALVPPVRRLMLVCGFDERQYASGKICVFDARKEEWTVLDNPTFDFNGFPLGGRAVSFRDNTVLMTTGNYSMFIDVDRCFGITPSTITVYSKGGFECNSRSSILKLDDGGLLILGGTKKNGQRAWHDTSPSHRIYNEICSNWTEVSTRQIPQDACCVVMRGGRVLVVGGQPTLNHGTRELTCCSVFHVESRRFTKTNPLNIARVAAAGCLLPDGTVFVCGGNSETCEIYDPATRKWTQCADMRYSRMRHTCTLIDDSRVFIAGGNPIEGAGATLQRCEIYDIKTKTSRLVADIPIKVVGHSMIALHQ